IERNSLPVRFDRTVSSGNCYSIGTRGFEIIKPVSRIEPYKKLGINLIPGCKIKQLARIILEVCISGSCCYLRKISIITIATDVVQIDVKSLHWNIVNLSYG